MRLRALLAATAVAAVALPVTSASAATHSKHTVREFSGTVAAVAKSHKLLRLKRPGKSSVRFTLGRSTRVTGVASRSALTKGQLVTIAARRTRDGWVARKVAVKAPTKPKSGTDPAAGGDPDSGDDPGADYGDDPGADYGDDPGADYGDDSGTDYGDDPDSDYGDDSGAGAF